MATMRLFSNVRPFLEKNFLQFSPIFSKFSNNANSWRYCSTVLGGTRTYELGNFARDLKPFLKTRKKMPSNLTAVSKFNNEEPVIKCKDQHKNHYRNQMYNKFKPVPLASENWISHKSVGDFFVIDIYSKDYKISESPKKKFEDSNIRSEIIDILKARDIKTMSPVQEQAWPKILSGYNTIIAGEAGCGKTLAYLLPTLEQVLNYKAQKEDRFNSPFVIILTPSRELTEQIHEVIKWFQPLNVKSHKILGGYFKRKVFNPQVDDIDFLVCTVGAISKFIATGVYSLKNVRHVILDETDALLDDSFNDTTITFLKKFRFHPVPSESRSDKSTQLTLVSATMPTSLNDLLGEIIEVDLFERVTTTNLHKAMPHVPQKFLRVNRSTKPAYLLQIVKSSYRQKQPLIIFCNNTETCIWLSIFLNDNKIENVNLNGDLDSKLRKDRFKKFQSGKNNVLVCTSVAARGLDTTRAQHVVNYEFPLFIADYIHRCGRTGRLGSKVRGKVTNLIASKNEIALVQKIEKSVRLKTEFENVNANIKRIINFKGASAFGEEVNNGSFKEKDDYSDEDESNKEM